MIIDNIDQIKSLLKFGKNTYYFIQVIQRRKENPNLEKAEIQRGFWYITSLSDLDIHSIKIKYLCLSYNARAYISLIPRSLEKFAKQCVIKFGERIYSGDYTKIFSIQQKVALSKTTIDSGIFKKPYWILDVDSDKDEVDRIIKRLPNLVIIDKIPTVNGFHLIVECFNPARELTPIGFVNSSKKSNDFIKSDENLSFTLIQTCNTVLYAAT